MILKICSKRYRNWTALKFSKHGESRHFFGICLFFAGIALLGGYPGDLNAAKLEFYSAPGNVFITITGEIVEGDARRFTAFVESAKSTVRRSWGSFSILRVGV
jgi:hypothetical protein